MKKLITICAVVMMMLAISGVAQATITVISGDIETFDPTATSFGAVRFKDFTNTKDGYGASGNLYLQDSTSSLGSSTGLDGRARVQSTSVNGPTWAANTTHPFSIEFRPVIDTTGLILASAANMTAPLSRVIDDPSKSVNYISFYILNRTLSSGDITVNLTDLDGNVLSQSALTLSAVGEAKWYLTDSTLLANGFILSGSIALGSPVDAGETDKIDISFGHAVPEPATMAILGLGGLLLRRKKTA